MVKRLDNFYAAVQFSVNSQRFPVIAASQKVVLLRLSYDLSASDLEFAANYINQNFRGWEMEALRNEIARRIQQGLTLRERRGR